MVKKRNTRIPGYSKKEQSKHATLMRDYGISLKQYNTLRLQQKYSCKICNMPEDLSGKGLVVDHCHNSGHVRGLLCGTCNTGIGLFFENKRSLLNAIEYLKETASKFEKE